MKTDAEILLALLGEDCCCDCCEKEAAATQDRSTRASDPLHPQMLTKRLPPLEIPGGDLTFVPALYPERETPQLPEPGHVPAMLSGHTPTTPPGLLYGQTAVAGESGFAQGLMLDDGTLDDRLFGEINHQTRIGRMWSGNTTDTLTYDAPGYGVRAATPAFLASFPADRAATGDVVASRATASTGSLTAKTSASAMSQLLEIAGLGRVLQGRLIAVNGGPLPVNVTQSTRFDEYSSVSFGGVATTYAEVTTNTSGTLDAMGTTFLASVETDIVIASAFASAESYTTREGHTTFNDPNLRIYQNTWTTATNVVHNEFYLVHLNLAPASIGVDQLYGRDPSFGGDGIHLSHYTLTPAGTVIGGTFDVTTGAAVAGRQNISTTFADGTPVTFTEYYVESVIYIDTSRRLPPAASILPTVSFQSPTLNGHSFKVRLTDVTARGALALEPSCTLEGMVVNIDTGPDLTGWRSFSSFRTRAGGITLILDTPDRISVTPELNAANSRDVAYTDLLAEWGLSGTVRRLGGHLGHHSYPEDRAYLLLEHPTDFQWVAFGEWDAYRDVSAEAWAALGLAKPRTRAIFEAGLTLPTPIPTPPRPAHGLALYDVFAPITGV